MARVLTLETFVVGLGLKDGLLFHRLSLLPAGEGGEHNQMT